jgi:hypothetical protein
MKITEHNSRLGSCLYNEAGKPVLRIIYKGMVDLVGKDSLKEPSSWWFYQTGYVTGGAYKYGNISFEYDLICVTIKK